jgi:hypothetical protein
VPYSPQQNAKSAKEAWDGLKQFYDLRDLSSQMWLRERWATLRYTAKDMATHIMELEDLVTRMPSAGCGPTQE